MEERGDTDCVEVDEMSINEQEKKGMRRGRDRRRNEKFAVRI